MAESKGSLLAKSVQKHAGRAKEKILQNLGKVDRTADDIFDEHLQNFNRQQLAANKLQKEFNNYIRCIRAAQLASKSLMETISEIYESQWSGHDQLYVQCQSVDMLWQDFSHKLGEQVLLPLNTYQSQFLEMRKKIDKRGRKLVDYDSQRHNFQSLQTSMAKKRDDTKLSKGREQLEEAKRTYEMLNSELHDELPALYDSRILFLVTNLQSLFSAEENFHSECSKIYAELEAIVDKLATDSQRGSYNIKKSNGSTLPSLKPISTSNAVINNVTPQLNYRNVPSEHAATLPTNNNAKSEPKAVELNNDSKVDTPTKLSSRPSHDSAFISNANSTSQPSTPTSPPPASPPTTPTPPTAPDNKPQMNGNSSDDSSLPPLPTTAQPSVTTSNNQTDGVDTKAPPVVTNDNGITSSPQKKVEELYDIPVGASTDNLPPGVLYKVKATYKYNREDVDELTFDVGEIIQVVEYDDPEEQEEGWLMGIKESTGEKGMFPANFTKPI
ncbi:myc box-dependent-interacting protein 1 isoform X1 [Agrilus planipennis]|uniref:Myc box-dependent-interacting protein 1 isoform X1 n=1 Tax=Agrilus planipennis TaxID=224129 RepID=A0A7F5R306_AGRPL|nr:myc box-dependent-interacting protein 1 isoform X1 [Agrilus planipennis]